jgi:hypothetical protein
VAEQTVTVPADRGALGRRARLRAPERHPALQLLWRGRWVLGALVMLALGLVVVLWANTRPGYDPYGWLVWGHLTLHGKLDTNGAPSWKPLPFIFTVPYALIGHRALWLWMITSVAVSLSGFVFAARIAYRLTNPPADRRWVGWVAGLAAAVFLLGIVNYTHFVLSAQSDTMIVALVLGAIDCHLYGRPRWAFVFGVLAALGRPEGWPLLGLWAIWAWFRVPRMRWVIIVGLLVIPALWFGIPALTSKSWFTAGNIALKSPRALHENKFTGEIDRFFDLHETVIYLLALFATVVAALRRDRTTVLLAGAAVLWVAVEVAFVLHGWPGVPRYLFEAGGITTTLAGVAIGRILLELPAAATRLAPGRAAAALAATGLAAVIVALIAVALLPAAHNRITVERADLKHERDRTMVINHLSGLIARLGGPAKLFYCGQPTTQIGYQSVLAWDLGANTGELFWTPRLGKRQPRPVVLFQPTPHAWKVMTIDTPPAKRRQCQSLNVVSLLSGDRAPAALPGT